MNMMNINRGLDVLSSAVAQHKNPVVPPPTNARSPLHVVLDSGMNAVDSLEFDDDDQDDNSEQLTLVDIGNGFWWQRIPSDDTPGSFRLPRDRKYKHMGVVVDWIMAKTGSNEKQSRDMWYKIKRVVKIDYKSVKTSNSLLAIAEAKQIYIVLQQLPKKYLGGLETFRDRVLYPSIAIKRKMSMGTQTQHAGDPIDASISLLLANDGIMQKRMRLYTAAKDMFTGI